MSADRDALFAWIDATLDAARYKDYSPVGLQIEGAPTIEKVALGVSANMALIEAAAAWGAQAILVHHGFFWRGEPQILRGWRKARVKALLVHDISLGGYHLPLDGHPTLGNNAQLGDLIGLSPDGRVPFARAGGMPIGLIGRFDAPRPAADVLAALTQRLHPNPIAFMHGPDLVTTVGIVTGGGGRYFEEARDLGAQLFVSGEAEEPTMAEARETHSHFIAAGHYWTETLGIQALGDAIAANFDVETKFFTLPNPV